MAAKTNAYTVPGMTKAQGTKVAGILQDRLNALNDLALTLKHVHWNVIGPHFIAVHEMIDPQVDAVRAMVDETAERIATLGVAPVGTPGALVTQRTWDDYSLGRAGAIEHLGALDVVYTGVIEAHRQAMDDTEDPDPVTQDMLIGQLGQLELFHWFVRGHLETAGGEIPTTAARTEKGAAKKAAARARRGTR
ncbi:MAG TPA: DNA starvation/stationary phase protection protein [Actinomycetales bacterium]|nr:DNA starvation/stationary phase protection protein [Actinomycetales bacterium]